MYSDPFGIQRPESKECNASPKPPVIKDLLGEAKGTKLPESHGHRGDSPTALQHAIYAEDGPLGLPGAVQEFEQAFVAFKPLLLQFPGFVPLERLNSDLPLTCRWLGKPRAAAEMSILSAYAYAQTFKFSLHRSAGVSQGNSRLVRRTTKRFHLHFLVMLFGNKFNICQEMAG